MDESILRRCKKAETSNPGYVAYLHEAFDIAGITASERMVFHAKDGPYVPYERTRRFAEMTGVGLTSLRRGGHLRTEYVVQRYRPQIKKFFGSSV